MDIALLKRARISDDRLLNGETGLAMLADGSPIPNRTGEEATQTQEMRKESAHQNKADAARALHTDVDAVGHLTDEEFEMIETWKTKHESTSAKEYSALVDLINAGRPNPRRHFTAWSGNVTGATYLRQNYAAALRGKKRQEAQDARKKK